MMSSKNKKKNQKIEDSSIVAEISGDQLEKIREEAKRKAREADHRWRQRGPWLVCDSCDHPHGTWVGTDKVLVGFDDGEPVFDELM